MILFQMKIINKIVLCTMVVSLFVSCGRHFPQSAVDSQDSLLIYPDYKDVVIPVNIAPLNFVVDNKGSRCAARITAPNGMILESVSSDDMKLAFDPNEWHAMLAENPDSELSVDVCVDNGQWCKFPTFHIKVVPDSIDPYVTCRLIEPLYNSTGKIGLFQFSLENGTHKVIASNKRCVQDPSHEGPKCVNCHTKQRNGSGNSLFFCRERGGGMVLTYNGCTRIVDTKTGDMRVSAVFSAWHPTKPYIAFSNNKVMQLFVSQAPSKIEPLDYYSDLLLYDIEKNEVSYICKTSNVMETNPYWSPDGKYVYYCSSDSSLNMNVYQYKKIKYDLMRVRFIEDSMAWGKPEMVYCATKFGKSVSKPKVSPDGRYVLFTMSEFGGYHYSHPDSDIYLYDLQNDNCRNFYEVNTSKTEGIGDWSSSGRWVMVSCREDGTYARLFFSYFDRKGKAYKRFQLPHDNPSHDREMTKNYNAPEFGNFDVQMTPRELYDLVDDGDVLKANYKGDYDYQVDGNTGASVLK